MLPECDFVTFHTPLTPETRGMLGERNIRLMKDGAIVINTSRGGVEVEHDIFEALTRGKLAAAGLDVWEREPAPVDGPLLNMPNVVCSTHIAGVTVEAHRVAGLQVAGEMLRVLRGERPDVLVNPDVWPRLGMR
jgi:phosphoglycerate dehydrogenase-like enzyme